MAKIVSQLDPDDAISKKQKTSHQVDGEDDDCVAILDCGAQFGKVIDRRVRELSVRSEIVPLDSPTETLRKFKALIISGGPQSVYGIEAPKYNPDIFTLGLPVLGICYGMQLLNFVHSGSVVKMDTREDGQFEVSLNEESLLFKGLGASTEVLLTHGDSVQEPAAGFVVSARSPAGLIAAIEHPGRKFYGVQFHPEVDLTVEGQNMLKNFLFEISNLTPSFTLESRKDHAVKMIRETVGDSSVLVLVSGGVDSSVCAALLREALPKEKILALHVDTGFMRYEESATVDKALREIDINLTTVDASEAFFSARTTINGSETEQLDETVAPEVKRKIIGDTFMRVSEREIKKFGLEMSNCFLAQGTLRPDLIESASEMASGSASVIKTHHNDTELVRALRKSGRIVEPLKDYHKDEVRQLGLELGLPGHLVWRQPFPGPGLAIRIICCDSPFHSDQDDHILAKLKAISNDEITATLLPCRTVGVQGDARTYRSLVALSCEGKPDWSKLLKLAKEIPKTVHGVNRVVFAFGPKLPGGGLKTVTNTTLTKEVVVDLQKADHIVNQALLKYDLIRPLSQVPVILFPVDFGCKGKRSICIRTFITNDFMTGVPATPGKQLPLEMLDEVVGQLEALPHIARVCYDLTAKPPGTTEWE